MDSRIQSLLNTNSAKLELFASSPPSSTLIKFTTYPIERSVPSSQRNNSIGGAFDLVGKPNGYEVVAHATSNALVNPRIEVTVKNEKSICNL